MTSPAQRAVAIVGVGAIFPDAPDADAFWANVRDGHYAISDVDPARWDPALYYDADPKAPDMTYSTIGGWVREWDWNPLAWKLPIPPRVGEGMDDAQKWAVACTRSALMDYGWPDRPLDRERTAVVLGNAMAGEKHYLTCLRLAFPELARDLDDAPSFAALAPDVRAAISAELHARMEADLPPTNEDTMPGELGNCLAGRVANLFNLRGPNFVIDAACASTMAAMDASIQGLLDHQFDSVVTGGVDRNMGVASFIKFCAIGALSSTGTRPYADGADGFVMGEGAGLFLLKRLADAERDGDRIYAVVRGMAGSSDGKGKGLTAPNPIGQKLAIERAWRNAGLSPAACSLMEGHGTSTAVGDYVELSSLAEAFAGAGLAPGSVALGSVKSNIGHLKSAAGAAGMLKATLAIHHKVLPPSLGFAAPNPSADWSSTPFAVNTELRDWEVPDGTPRVAGVSAFGFGGTNYHAVIEEYVAGRLSNGNGHATIAVPADVPAATAAQDVPSAGPPPPPVGNGQPGHPPAATVKPPLRGAFLAGAADEAGLAARLRALVESGDAPPPNPAAAEELGAAERICIDYGDAGELSAKAKQALKAIESGNPAAWKALQGRGIFRGSGAPGKVAFLYTGQGSQYANMLAELRRTEPIVAATFDEADVIMRPLLGGRALSDIIFVGPEGVADAEAQLMRTEITQPAVLTVDIALTRLLAAYGIEPDFVMGHSLGEYGALVAAGIMSFPGALEAVSARGRGMANLTVGDPGALAAVSAPLEAVERVIEEVDGYVVLANVNSTRQLVLGGDTDAVDQAVAKLIEQGERATRLPVSHAFHTRLVAGVTEPLRATLERMTLAPARIPVVANVDGEFYPTGPGVEEQIIDTLARQVASPVQFVKGLHTLYDAGARVLVETGPKRALWGFAADVLGDDVMTLFTNHPKVGELASFNQALCGLYAAGVGAPSEPAAAAALVSTSERPARDDEPVVITGAAAGTPGTEKVFDDGNLSRLLHGEQFIHAIPARVRREIAERHITRLVKGEDGTGTFQTIDDPADVIKLAGRAGEFDLGEEFGIDADRLAALGRETQLAIAAGIDALRDAGIPLIQHYKDTTRGTKLPDKWRLPDALQDDTGVIFASAFPGSADFVGEMNAFWTERVKRARLEELSEVRAGTDAGAARDEIDRRIAEIERDLEQHPYHFDRRFLFRVLSMGHSQLAELIGARGPNTQINAACASTTQAVSMAEDWIRAGRCRRVVIVAADDVTSETLLPWVGSGFLASGAAATDELVEDAALPFDRRRHGMILGMGAAGIVVESAAAARERGVTPICEVLGAVTANSAFHGSRLDVEHIGGVMESVVRQAEARGVTRDEIAPETLFVSHETYTPARGGSAAAEISALRRVFGEQADRIVVANTKGSTGHTMGVGVEDIVAIKALETGLVPAVPNFREIDPELGALNLSKGGQYPVRFALRLAAGFGSQISMLLLRWTPVADGRHRPPEELGYEYRIADQAVWKTWLRGLSRQAEPQLEVVKRHLRVMDTGPATNGALTPVPVAEPVAAPAPVAPAAVAPPVAAPAPVIAPAAVAPPVAAPAPVIAPVAAAPPVAAPAPVIAPVAVAPPVAAPAPVIAPVAAAPPVAAPAPVIAPVAAAPPVAAAAPVIAPVAAAPPVAAAAPVIAPAAAAPPAPVPAADPPPAPVATPAPVAPAPTTEEITAAILEIVAVQTGYPADMLDPELDLEADLGIDTVKQAEMFAAIRERYTIARDDTLNLRDYPTLRHVVGFVEDRVPGPEPVIAPAAAAPPAPVPAADPPPAPVATPVAVAPAPTTEEITAAILEIVAVQTGYPADMLDPELDLEADLGIDTVKQAEMFAAIRERYTIARDDTLNLRDYPTLRHVVGFVEDRVPGAEPVNAPAAAAPPAPVPAADPPPAPVATPVAVAPAPTTEEITAAILEIVAVQTGYPADMLDPELDLEADLGIDTVKQAEMFAAIRERYTIARDDTLNLRDYPTLRHVVGFVEDRVPGPEPVIAPAAAAPPAPVPAADPPPAPVATPVAVAPAPTTEEITAAILEIVAVQTGYPADMLDPELDLEADLGIDTVKQAEMFAAIRERYTIARDDTLNLRDYPTLRHVVGFVEDRVPGAEPVNAPAAAAPPAPVPAADPPPAPVATPVAVAPAPTTEEITAAILEIVAAQTGYPADMLDPELDLEADLGIDTVKQAEMFAAIRERYTIARDDTLNLRDYPTLRHVVGFVEDRVPGAEPVNAPAAAAPPAPVPAADPPPAPVATPVAVAPAPTTEEITAAILEIVAAQTGYPADMLDPELDLEADLGIDTVKQAEMFAAIRERYTIARDDTLNLRDYPTLRHVVGFVEDRVPRAEPVIAPAAAAPPAPAPAADPPPAPAATPAPAAPEPAADPPPAPGAFPRRVPVPVLRPPLAACVDTGVTLDAGVRVVLMPDQGGVAAALAERLVERGVEVLSLNPAIASDAVEARLAEWSATAPIQGVYWLPALDEEGPLAALEPGQAAEALRVRVKLLAVTMRALTGGFLVSGTRLGGRHGYDAPGATSALGGAVTGFTKALARERPGALVKAVDFASGGLAPALADLLVEETLCDPGAIEIGHADELRWSVGLIEEPTSPEPGRALTRDTVFVVTGAAGSIVSAITADLAAASAGTFHLLDLVPAPDAGDPDLGRFETDPDGLKHDLADRLRARGERPTPKLVDRELARIERARAALAAVTAIERAGGSAHWHQVDLTDPDAVAAALAGIDRVDVLMHAAGLEISHYLPDKPQAEFDLVFDVKAGGWLNLLHALGQTQIGSAVVFSSIAGRFGNAGQTDYAAANDLLCKSVSQLRRSGTRGIALDWTAWADIGMASRGSIPKMMEAAGIDMLPSTAGVPVVHRELTGQGPGGEVVVAGALGVLLDERHATGGLDPVRAGGAGPMTGRIAAMTLGQGLTVRTELDPDRQPFLHDHRIGGTPVLPGVMGMEAFAEASRVLLDGWQVVALEDVDLLAPVKFYRDEPRTLELHAQIRDGGDSTMVADCELVGRRPLPDKSERETRHFTGRARLSRTFGVAPQGEKPESAAAGRAVVGHAELYRVYFHGPAYQVLGSAWRENGHVIGTLAGDLPPGHEPALPATLFLPRLIELCFQTLGVWEIGTTGRMWLPSHVDRVLRYAGADEPGPLWAVVTPRDGGADADVVDADGRVRVRLEGYRTVELPGGMDDDALAPLRDAMADR